MIALTNKTVKRRVTLDYSIATMQVPKDIGTRIKGIYRTNLSTSIRLAVEDLFTILDLFEGKHPAVVIDKLKQQDLFTDIEEQKIA